MPEVFILSAKRTPIASLSGALASYKAPQLGAKAIAAAVAAAGVQPGDVSEVIMGNVVGAGMGQAPARQAAIGAGLPIAAGATTVNKVCGSGMKAVMMGGQSILTGDSDIVVAGGMESMSNAPYLLAAARSGYRLGHGKLIDSIVHDGLWDPYKDVHMGICGELCAEQKGFSRQAQDEYAVETYRRALKAQEEGAFATELVPLAELSEDEEPKRAKLEKMGRLKPAFKADGTITAANASKINDGAAALVLAGAGRLGGRKPLARIAGWATFSQEPEWFTTAPAFAIKKLLEKTGWKLGEVDLFEVNEAFSVVALAVMQETGLSREKLNVNGGAVALGHPIGASGARILTTLVHALARRDLKRGIASICLGGGEAVAVAVER
ncbi:MAG: acetyl-CoA acetyltransferase [Elusimicrobia bacterium GWA2_69_24]|nr:MAG: acetyl-CoA acetyltransferase [Elusimicrobia bacterium GWA2_69_24]HBL18942.1 acetyl-CoA C-acetyltransferase [Elusimicrobiota bacterium]